IRRRMERSSRSSRRPAPRRRRAVRSSSTSAGCRTPAEAKETADMGIEIRLILIAVGAILTWGVKDTSPSINLDAVGVILMIVGATVCALSLLFWWSFWGAGYFRRSYAAEGPAVARRTVRRAAPADVVEEEI